MSDESRYLYGIVVPAHLIARAVIEDGLIDRYGEPPIPFPEDTRYLRAYYDAEKDAFVLIVEHPSFCRTPAGAAIMHVRVVRQAPLQIEPSLALIEGE